MKTIIFVYNADSGKANAFLDSLHKIASPNSYNCSLCKLTHGAFSEKREWKQFRQNLNFETVFLHRDEFRKQYASKFGHKFEYPVILLAGETGLELLVSSEELNHFRNLKELIATLEKRLS